MAELNKEEMINEKTFYLKKAAFVSCVAFVVEFIIECIYGIPPILLIALFLLLIVLFFVALGTHILDGLFKTIRIDNMSGFLSITSASMILIKILSPLENSYVWFYRVFGVLTIVGLFCICFSKERKARETNNITSNNDMDSKIDDQEKTDTIS